MRPGCSLKDVCAEGLACLAFAGYMIRAGGINVSLPLRQEGKGMNEVRMTKRAYVELLDGVRIPTRAQYEEIFNPKDGPRTHKIKEI